MKGKQVYDLTVRGESVHIEFRRINDSRRISGYSRKSPNFFLVRSVLQCRVEIPPALASAYWKERYPNHAYPCTGMAFCTWRDRWNAQRGRHLAMADALAHLKQEEEAGLVGEITAAFTLAEARRMPKAKGPERSPRTAPPKPRKQKRPELVQVLADLRDVLQRMGHPMYSMQTVGVDQAALQQTMHHVANHPPFTDVRPADTPVQLASEEEIARLLDRPSPQITVLPEDATPVRPADASVVEIVQDRMNRAMRGEDIGPTSGLTYGQVIRPADTPEPNLIGLLEWIEEDKEDK